MKISLLLPFYLIAFARAQVPTLFQNSEKRAQTYIHQAKQQINGLTNELKQMNMELDAIKQQQEAIKLHAMDRETKLLQTPKNVDAIVAHSKAQNLLEESTRQIEELELRQMQKKWELDRAKVKFDHVSQKLEIAQLTKRGAGAEETAQMLKKADELAATNHQLSDKYKGLQQQLLSTTHTKGGIEREINELKVDIGVLGSDKKIDAAKVKTLHHKLQQQQNLLEKFTRREKVLKYESRSLLSDMIQYQKQTVAINEQITGLKSTFRSKFGRLGRKIGKIFKLAP